MHDVTSQSEISVDWERRVAEAWATMDSFAKDDFISRIGELAAELPADSAVGLFEHACA